MTDKAILVVEDDPDGQELLARMLFRANIPVEITGSAEDALKLISADDHFAMIIDLNLPGMDGFDLIQHIRDNQQTKDLPCIAITAYHTPVLKMRVMNSGFTHYFAKPLDDRRLIATLHDIGA